MVVLHPIVASDFISRGLQLTAFGFGQYVELAYSLLRSSRKRAQQLFQMTSHPFDCEIVKPVPVVLKTEK
jgi:hypothetical protein